DVFAGKKSAQIREILISESAWEEMTCLFAPSLRSRDYHFYVWSTDSNSLFGLQGCLQDDVALTHQGNASYARKSGK
ncbi:hypothetical protein ACMWJ3_28605, partial [Klebsiella quasipneumoniae]